MFRYFFIFILFIFMLSCNDNDFRGDWYLDQTKITITQDRLIFKDNKEDFLIYEQKKNDPNVFELIADFPDEKWIVKILVTSNDSLVVFDSLFNQTRYLYKTRTSSKEFFSN